MARKKKKKLPNIDNVKKTITESGEESCQCNWSMAVECVDDLMEWVDDLCKENLKLKNVLKKTIDRLSKDNKNLREQLDALPNVLKDHSK
jgi:hypothetical protein